MYHTNNYKIQAWHYMETLDQNKDWIKLREAELFHAKYLLNKYSLHARDIDHHKG